MPKDHQQTGSHIPVLLEEVLRVLHPGEGQSYLDLTAGYGGHAGPILEATGAPGQATLVDRDAQATAALKKRFGEAGAKIVQQDFAAASQQLMADGRQFDLVLADLGVSSLHLEDASRGFAIQKNGPLDMRLDQSQELTAADIVNHWSQKQLARLLKDYGQEPKAGGIARRIVAKRPIATTTELAELVRLFWPGPSKIHPATRTFQALRIAVNQELAQLENSLPLWVQLLAPGGRLAVISFHSLEDRLVKQFFAEQAKAGYEAEIHLLTKKPIMAGPEQIVSNPRARSARLRAVEKIKIKKKG